MAKFLHTADWQVGRLFSTFDQEHAPLLAEARTTVVERIARLAIEHQVDAILVAGDVFDAQTVSERTVRRLFNAMQGFSGPWLMISGNHDAALVESVWSRATRLGAVPTNVHLLLTPKVKLFEAQGFAVLPAPLTQRHTYGDLTAWFDGAPTPESLLRIGLAHGSVQGILADDIDSANPIAPDRPTLAHLDYLALGDWHGTKIINSRMAYSGTPEPDRFKSNDAGNVLLVDVPAAGAEPVVTVLPTGQYRWRILDVSLQVETDIDQLVDELSKVGPDEVVDLEVSGQVGLEGQQRLNQAIGAAEARARHLQADLSNLRLAPSDDDIASLKADGYLAEVIAELRDAANAADGQTAQDALALLAGEMVVAPDANRALGGIAS